MTVLTICMCAVIGPPAVFLAWIATNPCGGRAVIAFTPCRVPADATEPPSAFRAVGGIAGD
jgi:hypothetical protein